MSADSLRLATGTRPATERESAPAPGLPAAIDVRRLSLWYDQTPALEDISLAIAEHQVTAFIGPSGCGKSTLLRSFNRMNDHNEAVRHEGSILLYGKDIHADDIDPVALRREVGMVFQKPNPFAKSVFDNVAYGLRLQGIRDRSELAGRVEWALRSAALWDEVADRLDDSALQLSGGQQQRLVIARAIAVRPRVILLDEPCSSLDPISTLKVEELITELKDRYTIVIVTHNMQQAARVSDFTAFLYMGRLVEYGDTDGVFTNPARKQTEDYITGRYG